MTLVLSTDTDGLAINAAAGEVDGMAIVSVGPPLEAREPLELVELKMLAALDSEL